MTVWMFWIGLLANPTLAGKCDALGGEGQRKLAQLIQRVGLVGLNPEQTLPEHGLGLGLFYGFDQDRGASLVGIPTDPEARAQVNLIWHGLVAPRVVDKHIAVLGRSGSEAKARVRIYDKAQLKVLWNVAPGDLSLETIKEFTISHDLKRGAFVGEDGLLTLVEFDESGEVLKAIPTHRAIPISYLGQDCIAATPEGAFVRIAPSGKILSRSVDRAIANPENLSPIDFHPETGRVLLLEKARLRVLDFSQQKAKLGLIQSIPEDVDLAAFDLEGRSIAFVGGIRVEDGVSVGTVGRIEIDWSQEVLQGSVAFHHTVAAAGATELALARHPSGGWVVAAYGFSVDPFPASSVGIYRFLPDRLEPLGSIHLGPATEQEYRAIFLGLSWVGPDLVLNVDKRTPRGHRFLRYTIDAVHPSRFPRIESSAPVFPADDSTHKEFLETMGPAAFAMAEMDPLTSLQFQPSAPPEIGVLVQGERIESGQNRVQIKKGRVYFRDGNGRRTMSKYRDADWLIEGPAGSFFVIRSEKEDYEVRYYDPQSRLVAKAAIQGRPELAPMSGIAPSYQEPGYLLIPTVEPSGYLAYQVFHVAYPKPPLDSDRKPD